MFVGEGELDRRLQQLQSLGARGPLRTTCQEEKDPITSTPKVCRVISQHLSIQPQRPLVYILLLSGYNNSSNNYKSPANRCRTYWAPGRITIIVVHSDVAGPPQRDADIRPEAPCPRAWELVTAILE